MKTALLLIVSLLAAVAPQSAQAEDRLFELRTYYAAPGKFDALNTRFRDTNNALFKKHGMTVVGYWVPPERDRLIYILAFKDKADADTKWKAFRADPDFVATRDAAQSGGQVVLKIDSVFMSPTEYSPLK